jgi:hypothetical protein
MIRSCWGPAVGFAVLLGAMPSGEATAQVLSFTPTFQQSLSRYDSFVPQSDFQALGFMVGLPRTSGWWQPHVWFQRYFVTSAGQQVLPDGAGKGQKFSGWMLSVGPAIEFLRRGPIQGDLLPQLGLGSGTAGDLNGGAGIHFGFDFGFFQPGVFGRYQTLGPSWFWTLGVGMTFEVRWEDVASGGSFWN